MGGRETFIVHLGEWLHISDVSCQKVTYYFSKPFSLPSTYKTTVQLNGVGFGVINLSYIYFSERIKTILLKVNIFVTEIRTFLNTLFKHDNFFQSLQMLLTIS